LASGHERASPKTRELCKLLVDGLKTHLPGLQTNATQNWCSIGKPTFGYVSHRRDRLSLFLRCPESGGSALAGLVQPTGSVVIDTRRSLDTAWAKMTPYSVKISTREAATAIAPLLLYAAQLRKTTTVFLLPSEDCAAERF
jgi:hypothetical protein